MLSKSIFTALSLFLATFAMADNKPLEGFLYAKQEKPSGNEWQSPEELSLNKEQPHAWFFSFKDTKSARLVLPDNSSYYKSLNGEWKFNFAKNPDERPADFYKNEYDVSGWDNIKVPSNWNIEGVQKDGSLKYGVPIYVNQWVIFSYERKVGDWKKGVMRVPPKHYTTYEYRNEVGSYKRNFQVPQDWDGREIYVNFEGVDSFFYLWINGKYIGFSKNSRNTASFNITEYVVKGNNTISVEVYRSSDASFLEAQDMFRLPGIFRTVSLTSKPKVQVSDIVVNTDLDNTYTNAELKITASLKNLSKKNAKGCTISYTLYKNELYSDKNSETSIHAQTVPADLKAMSGNTLKCNIKVENPLKWSAESPYRYTLVGQLKDNKGKVIETFSTYIGFREVEILDTPASKDEFGLAGRYFYINGKPAKLKGVNRHESSPVLGHAITREVMEKEVMLMKRANINHVRTSHYPQDSYMYYLYDKYGIYVEDEANLESHEYFYGKESLSHPIEWRKAHVARVMEMVHRDINHPCIVIWSLGNEAGPGDNFIAAYDTLKAFDKTRPVQYERNNNIVDMGSNQYPSIGWMQRAVTGKMAIKYPFHISEYAHSMGNAVGNLVDYWNAIESTNFFCGGAIWDWVDQAMLNYTPTGIPYMAYGGDFGDTPNDGQFVMNGIVFADLEPKPQYYEVKKVYQYIGIKAKNIKTGEIEIFNKNYFTDDLSGYKAVYKLYENGVEVKEGNLNVGTVAPRSRKIVRIPVENFNLNPNKEYFVKIQFQLKENMPWAKMGYPQAEEQLFVRAASEKTPIKDVVKGGELKYNTNNNFCNVNGDNFNAVFDLSTGTIYSLTYGNNKMFENGNGPKIDAYRAFVNNDNWANEAWFQNGLHNLKHKVIKYKVTKGENLQIEFDIESQAPAGARVEGGCSNKCVVKDLVYSSFGEDDFKFTSSQIYTVYPDGSIELQSAIHPSNPDLALPRIGYSMELPQEYGNFTYYGRGPIDNYPDRKTGQFIELFKSTVKGEFENFPKPQDMGNHLDTRWCALTGNSGSGIIFVAQNPLTVSALPYSAMDLTLANHPYELPQSNKTYLHLDKAITGLGGNSCGQGGPLVHDRVLGNAHLMGFIIRPIKAGNNLSDLADVRTSGASPYLITQDLNGDVTILSNNKTDKIYYKLNDKRTVYEYKGSFNLKEGGKVEITDQTGKISKGDATFKKITNQPLKVIFASSEEDNEGNAWHMTDNKPNTYWHTMYSVTVANYPHWVDFDCGETKTITGFTFLPRQDSRNGLIKRYRVQVSDNAKTWSDPVIESEFPNDQNIRRVVFPKAVKARYIRFTALSSHDRQDFATGAIFKVTTEE